jgi:para-nitrobenzyl esterase
MTPQPDPIVQITPGRVRGLWRDGSAAFLGIPFAQAPVGDLRFAAPVPPEPWEGVRDAVEYGATAQRIDDPDSLIPEPVVPGDATLNVNVFTPAPGDLDARLPVLVWIHGGGYIAGSPASPWYDGRAFNRDGVVTVTISYRLGFDGFGHIAGAPSNRGVRDWLAALEWVRENIAAFGGNPDRVTIAGQSAGGGAVLRLLGMPAAQHLFHAVWASSGALADVTVERARTMSAKLANLAGVPPTRDGFASVPEATIHSVQEKAAGPAPDDRIAVIRALLRDGLAWGPTIDGDLITQSTTAALQEGIGSDKVLVLGSNDDEMTVLADAAKPALRFVPPAVALRILDVPREVRDRYLADNAAQRRKGTAAMVGRYATDVVFRSTVPRVAEARGAAPTWVYRFAWVSRARGWALHCLDVPFLFDCLDAERVAALAGDNPPQALADAVHGSAVAFVRDGTPGWPAWSQHPGATRVFGGAASRPDVEADGYASVRALV